MFEQKINIQAQFTFNRSSLIKQALEIKATNFKLDDLAESWDWMLILSHIDGSKEYEKYE